MKSLKNNTSIKILPADKGRATVIMNTDEYNQKVSDLLSDEITYTKVQRDPTSVIERKLRDYLQQLKRQSKITEDQYNNLMCLNGNVPSFYALPKIHKENVPMRPIVSFCGATLYKLSRFLKNIISPLVDNNEYIVKNNNSFLEDLRNVQLDEDEIMISFDVISLFTKTPLDLALSQT